MFCPVCDNVRMREVEREGVLIDICPNCKGVWLDRGELDKLLEEVRAIRQPFNEWYHEHGDKDYHEHSDHYGDHKYKGHKKHKKKRSFFDMFDDMFD
ncbi:MAG: zf-TFIIB domain-containing protein [Tuberibacillus sp.]